jgi:hypothetical protein
MLTEARDIITLREREFIEGGVTKNDRTFGSALTLACRIFCTSVSETTALLAFHPDGVTRAYKVSGAAGRYPSDEWGLTVL